MTSIDDTGKSASAYRARLFLFRNACQKNEHGQEVSHHFRIVSLFTDVCLIKDDNGGIFVTTDREAEGSPALESAGCGRPSQLWTESGWPSLQERCKEL